MGRPCSKARERLALRAGEQARFLVRVGGEDVDAEHHVRRRELLRRLEAARGRSRCASISCAGAKCEANANGRPSAAASCAPKRLEPRIQIGTLEPGARHRAHALARLRRRESTPCSSSTSLRELVGTRRKRAPERMRRERIGAGRAPEAEIDAARDTAIRACRTARRSRAARDSAA